MDRIGGYGAKLAREIDHRSVVEDQPLHVKLHVRSGRLPLPPGWIDEPLLPSPLRLPAGRRQARVRIEVTFGRRGRRRLPPPALVLRDPFGLAQRIVAGPATDEILVLPEVFPVNLTAGGGDATPAHAPRRCWPRLRRSRRPAAVAQGSPASRIHWQTFARSGVLMERELISEADSRPLVVIDPRAPSSPDALDAAVRAAGSLAVHFARKTGCSLLMPGDRRASIIEHDLLAWPALHVRLALLDDHTGPSLAAAQNRRGLVIYVAARPVDRAPRGLGRTPGGCLVVYPARWPTGARCSRSRCHGYVSGRQSGAAAVARWRARRERDARAAATRDGRATDLRACSGLASGDAAPVLPVALARALAFTALAAWGALHWMSMLEPAEPGAAG